MKDEWKDIIGFDGYQISDNGRVRSPRQILKQQVNHKGYCVVMLSRVRNYKRSFYVHRLVAEYFIENPNGYRQINHIDKDKSNNAKSNLEWCDAAYNLSYNGNRKRISQKHQKKICAFQENEQYTFESITKAASYFCVSIQAISRCLNGKCKTSCGYRWKYL